MSFLSFLTLRKRYRNIFICLFVFILPAITAHAQQQSHNWDDWDDWDVVPGKVIIKFKEGKTNKIKRSAMTSNIHTLTFKHIEKPVGRDMRTVLPREKYKPLLPNTYIGSLMRLNGTKSFRRLQMTRI